MTKAKNTSIEIDEVGIDGMEYRGRVFNKEGKYDAIFRKAEKGQRIYCPTGRESGIAKAYKKWLLINLGIKSPIISVRRHCEDGLGGVWWTGEKEAKAPKTVWQGLQKVG